MSAIRILLMLAVLSFRAGATVFFAMDTGTVDNRHKSAAEQVSLVHEIGFSGIGPMLSTPEALREMIRAADGKQVLIPAVYASLDLDVTAEPGPVIRDAIRQLKGRGSILWLSIQSPSHKVSDPALDARVVPILRALAADAGAHGVRVALYPHANMWLETVEDAMRLADQVDDPNLGVCFNLCHWLKVDAVDLDDSLRRAAPRLFVVTIQGADDGGKDWSTLIQPLGEGSYDVGALLAKLDALGFKGPIGLQHYGIRGDARVNLRKSMDAWRRLAGEKHPDPPCIPDGTGSE